MVFDLYKDEKQKWSHFKYEKMNGKQNNLKLASRLARLGTETSYKVSDESNELKKQGKVIYPFHIGDLNFKTPQVFVDSMYWEGERGFKILKGS